MIFQRLFFNNYLLMVSVLAWAAAQVCKLLLELVMTGKLNAERLFGSGGMPSSHSALVCSLVVGSAKMPLGLSSPYFAVAVVLAAIVMYDAMGVRLETGRQAKLLNKIVEDLREEGQQEYSDEKRLKELVGHTPVQVLSGALLGVMIAISIPVF